MFEYNEEQDKKYIRLERGVDEIKNNIRNRRLRWLGHVMWMREEMMPKKMLHTKMEGTT